jgi:(p)ppGpp synthase/HD superfamily hydrolase
MFSQETPDHALLMLTVAFAAKAHVGQKRKGKLGLSYIYHPINVTNNLITAGILDLATLQAALLHDVIEDTEYSEKDIALEFGDEVSALVKGLTDEDLPKEIRRAKQIEIAKSYDWRLAAVRTSDKIDNLLSIVFLKAPWSKDRIKEYADFTIKVVDAIPVYEQNIKLIRKFEEAVIEVDRYLESL